jgi:glyoxylase-like metal-dependent hydrolase (beta-lactamase superfamily II)
MKRNISKISAALSMVLMLVATVSAGQQNPAPTDEIQVLPVQGNVYMLIGAGSNVTVSAGVDGVLFVDTGREEMGGKVLETARALAAALTATTYPPRPCVGVGCAFGPGGGSYTQWGWSSPAINQIISSPNPPAPIRYIINTASDPDHTGGNAVIAAAGRTLTGGNVSRGIGGSGDGAEIWAHETVLNRMTEDMVDERGWPTGTYYTPKYKMNGFFNGEGIELVHVPAAHSESDTIVYFRYSDVISTGDVYSTAGYPNIDVEHGGTIQGVLDGLNRILDMAIPQFRAQGGTYIIPGHGRLSDYGDVANYRNMVAKVRDRIQAHIDDGMTLQQVKAARPTLDYDGRYGSPDAFIEAAYRSLSEKQ